MNTTRHQRVLALVGMPGTGKTLGAQHLRERGYFEYRFGSTVVNEVVRRGWAVNPENERIVREELRADEGMDVMAKRALPHLRQALLEHPVVVIDGLYSFSEYKTLHREIGAEMVVIAITSPRELRYQRLINRPERPLTEDEALRRDFQEIETLEKGGPIAIADYTLVNDGEPEELLAALDTLVEQLELVP